MINRYGQTIQITTRKDGQADDEQTVRQIRQTRKWTDKKIDVQTDTRKDG